MLGANAGLGAAHSQMLPGEETCGCSDTHAGGELTPTIQPLMEQRDGSTNSSSWFTGRTTARHRLLLCSGSWVGSRSEAC